MSISNTEIVLRMVLATVLGILLGFERRRHGKPVGARTHAIICIAAALTAIIGEHGFVDLAMMRDPTRLSVGVLTGLGFIGAGVIWRSNNGVTQGLTTAANIFATACIGIAIGFGYYFLSILSSVLILIVLTSSFTIDYLNHHRLSNQEHSVENVKNFMNKSSEEIIQDKSQQAEQILAEEKI